MRVGDILAKLGLDRFSGLYLWAGFIITFGIWIPAEFLTVATLHSVASSQAIAGMLALAVLIPLCCGQFDLSVGANANLTGIMAVVLQSQHHWPLLPAVVVALALGLFIGAVNGFVVVKLRVSSFIATLGMASILSAFETIVSGGQPPNPVVSSIWNDLSQVTVFGFQVVVLYLFAIGLLVWWLLVFTPAGRYLYAIGGNADGARLSGVKVSRWSWISLILAGGIAGFSGVMFVSLLGPSLSFGPSLLLPAFAAVFLGSTQFKPGKFNVWGTILAIYVLATGVQGLQLVSGQEWLSDMFNGVALIAAVALAVSRGSVRVPARIRRSGDGAAPSGEATDSQASVAGLGAAAPGAPPTRAT